MSGVGTAPHARAIGNQIMALAALLLAGMAMALAIAAPGHARMGQAFTSPAGIKGWLVEDHGVPIVAMAFSFAGGSTQDPESRGGLSHLLAEMLDEGSGPLSGRDFKSRIEGLGAHLSFSASLQSISGSLVSPKKSFRASVDLLRLVLLQPHFDADALELEKGRTLAEIDDEARNPHKSAVQSFYSEAFAGHPFARPVKGSPSDIKRVTPAELASHHRDIFSRETLHVVIVGDLTAAQAGDAVDLTFAELPKKAHIRDIPPATLQDFHQVYLDGVSGQKVDVAAFAVPTPSLGTDPFFAALALNQIVGSGNFDSRLTREIRISRGLTYSVSSEVLSSPGSSFLLGVLATRPGKMNDALAVLRATLAEVASDGPTERELANAKSSLIGSYFLQQNTSLAYAYHLAGLAADGLDYDYGLLREAKLEALTLETVAKTARELFAPDALRVIVLRSTE